MIQEIFHDLLVTKFLEALDAIRQAEDEQATVHTHEADGIVLALSAFVGPEEAEAIRDEAFSQAEDEFAKCWDY